MTLTINHTFLTKTQERKLITNWQDSNNPKLCTELLLAFKPLVLKIVKKYKYYGIPSEDLIQEAWLGICMALQRFDINKDVRFSSYAKWWINAYCQDYVMRNWSIVRVGTTRVHKKLFFQLRYLKNKLEGAEDLYFDKQTVKAIAKKLETTNTEVIAMYDRLTQKDTYLDQKINENFATTFLDLLIDENPSIENILINKQKQKAFIILLKTFYKFLETKELDILIRYRVQTPTQTLEEISNHYSITKEKIRQIEKRAIRKLRKAFMNLGIRTLNNY